MNETEITIVGNLVADPTLRFTPTGKAVSNVRIANTPRYKDTSGEWRDGDSLFITGTIWGPYGENVAESLQRGDEVIARGRLKQRTWDTQEGERRTSTEFDIAAIGPTVRKAPVDIRRVQRTQAPAQSAPSSPASAGYAERPDGWNHPAPAPGAAPSPWDVPEPAGVGGGVTPPF